MSKAISFSEIFHVASRFRRSVHIERDFHAENPLEGYVLTATARESLWRLINALENEGMSRAWTLTGPYGSGKSAFALFTAKALGAGDSPSTQDAQNLLQTSDAQLWERFKNNGHCFVGERGFCPILVSGSREPIIPALLRGLARGLSVFYETTQPPEILREIQDGLKKVENGASPTANDVTALFERATWQIVADTGGGLLLVVDELGKFLEYAAQKPAQGDVFVLQSLAETAARSGQTPFLMVAILHQAFERYAQRLAATQREEWAKVQGRFEEVPFVEPTEQILRLIHRAIKRTEEIESLREAGTHLATNAVELELAPRGIRRAEFVELLEGCIPLHPTVALILGPLFRKFAQNERSLFAFLTSSEPHGFSDFLQRHIYDGYSAPTLMLADLYDYVSTALGGSLYVSVNGKKWAEIESAIERLTNPSLMEVRLIKTIGVLGAVGEAGGNLKASEAQLRFALDDGSETYSAEFEHALLTLERRSIVVYRRYNDAYALWEGSDIDIEARLRETATHIDPNERLKEVLVAHAAPRPLIARRYSFKTGTMRYFAVRYTDLDGFDADLNAPFDDADGLVLYALPKDELEVERLVETATKTYVATRKEVLVAIPKSIGFLQEAVVELACLRWVEENTPELEGDATARRELSARLAEVERDVSDHLAAMFGGTSLQEAGCVWYHRGQPTEISSRRELNEYLSTVCDEVYCAAPILRNELINRRQPSSQATGARKNLIEAMLENGDQEKLGINGYPPEMSIYLSLLLDTGIHCYVSGVWGFHPPKRYDKNKMHLTWEAVEAFLDECEVERQSVAKLYEHLEKPPIGLRRGPTPILLCAVMLHYDAEIGLYENGSFVPDVSMAVFERLIKSPEKFELKRFRMAGLRTEVFEQFLVLLNQPQQTEIGHPNLLAVVKPLMRFISRLPRYTLVTRELSDKAIALRKSIQDAREPDELLFDALPKAVGFSPFGPNPEKDPTAVDEFFKVLRGAFSELSRAYDDLIHFIEHLLVAAFSLKGGGEEIRVGLLKRAEPLIDLTIETKLKGFLIRVCDEGLDFAGWLEAIGTYVGNKPPASWNDLDKAHFEMNLSELARKFHHFEALSFERQKQSERSSDTAGEVLRVGITTPKAPERERVVALPSTVEEQAVKIESAIDQVFESFAVDGNAEFRLAILARISQKLMQQLEDRDYSTD